MDDSVKTSWIRQHTLKAAGITYLFGDACLFLSGLLSGRVKEATAGLLYASGGAVSTIYGNPSDKRQIRNVGGRLGDFMIERGAQIPESSELHTLMKHRRSGLAGRIENFLYRHPAEIHTAIYALGGIKMMQSGFGKGASGHSDVAAGGLVTAGGLVGAFVPEKKDGNWITKKPLRLAGYLWMLNNVFLVKSGWEEYRANPKQHSYVFKFLTAGLFVAANILMSLSHRDHSSSGKDGDKKHIAVERMAAEVIAAQPEPTRDTLTREVAGFLSIQPEMHNYMPTLLASLGQKVSAIAPVHKGAESCATATTAWQDKTRISQTISTAMPAFS